MRFGHLNGNGHRNGGTKNLKSPSRPERIWKLEPRSLERARRSLDQISEQWDAAIDRLKMFVEKE